MQKSSDDTPTRKGSTATADYVESEWLPIEPLQVDARLAGSLSRNQARLWAMVLEARGLPCNLEQQAGHWQLRVPDAKQADALAELRHYEAENRHWPPRQAVPVPLKKNSLFTISLLLLLGIFHNLTHPIISDLTGLNLDWLHLGNADAGAIRAGQWWRTVTALTLHTGGLHLFGNLIIGGFFIDRLNRELGVGRGWLLILATGASGNLCNALLQPSTHRAVGLSTAIFGTVAILAVRSARHHRHRLQRRWPLPLAAALALLGLLGSSGETTDLGSHLWGFVAGLAIGWLSTLVWPGGQNLPRRSNLLAGLSAMALIIGAWFAALSGS